MSEHQLDLFNDTEHELISVESGDTLHIWYGSKKETDDPELICDIYNISGYGEIGFYVINGAWDGVLYCGANPMLKINKTESIVPVSKYKIIKNEPKLKETSTTDDDNFWNDNIAF